MTEGFIYKITSPSGKIYIGQTIDLINRISCYKSIKKIRNQKALYNDVIKYEYIPSEHLEIIEKIEFDRNLIDSDGNNLLDRKEIFYINLYNSCILNSNIGLNMNYGGKTRKGFKHSDETKLKMSKSKKGIKHSEEEKEKRRLSGNYGLKGKKGIPSKFKGVPRLEEVREKISKSSKGRIFSDETKLKMSVAKKDFVPKNRMRISAFKYSTGEYVGTYISYIECANALNISYSHITCVISGKRNHTYGYFFKKADEDNNS